MKKQLLTYWLYLLSLLIGLSFFFYFWTVNSTSYDTNISEFQEIFRENEQKLSQFLDQKEAVYHSKGEAGILKHEEKGDFSFHVYRNDSLISWNTNQLPVSRFADIHYPANGIVHLQNGWYYAKYKQIGSLTFAVSFLIKKEYPYENESLKNEFNPVFKGLINGGIILNAENAYPIYASDKAFLFGIDPYQQSQIDSFSSNFLFILFVLTLVSLLAALYKTSKSVSNRWFWLFPVGLLVIRYVILEFSGFSFLQNTSLFQPSLYADSLWNPNFGEYLINCVLLVFLSLWLLRGIEFLKKSIVHRSIALLVFAASFLFTNLISNIYKGLVENSSIPLEIDQLFTLNFYSFLAISSMGIIFYAYFLSLRSLVTNMIRIGFKPSFLVLLWFFSSVAYFFYAILYGNQLLFLACWPLLINGFIVLNAIRSQGTYKFGYGVVLLLFFSVYISVNLKEMNDSKERAERELFANQLASDQDIDTEIEYTQIKKSIQNDELLHKIIEERREISVSSFKEMMERKFFNNFWERYDIEFFLFDTAEKPVIQYKNVPESRKKRLDAIIEKHSLQSDVDSTLFYIKDYTSRYSYIFRELIVKDSVQIATLYCGLKSKKIPEKIGFPRLLISSKAKVFKSLEKYSIAKYYNGKLVSSNGKFSYPSRDASLSKNIENATGYFDSEDYNHYLLRKNRRDLIVLSKKNQSFIQLITSFSYLFSFYGLCLLIPIIINTSNRKSYWKGITLATRFQLVLIALVFISLVAFGLGSGSFVKNQYQEYTTRLIREKMRSVEIEVIQKLGDEKTLSIQDQGNYMEYILQKLANVFVTDINLYDANGYMLASSRPKIYNIGLLSEQINPKAFDELEVARKSEYIHQENIGNLDYLSGYVPFYSNDGKLLAYLNLQHFGQQKGFEDQIQEFLVAIMNVFVLLLAISIIVAIFISNWLTAPLRILQQNFAKVQLGKYNQPIEYAAEDEIGILVKEYNQKLEELAFTAQQLAQSERESAWREMAKQVAHEIKNPLTPMKLSLQHLQRVFDPSDPDIREKMARVTQSVIEQIDALANIANEFSNFAKMPVPKNETIQIENILKSVITVFEKESAVHLEFTCSDPSITLIGDKDMLLRVFNNLIKNAIQAIPSDREGHIRVNLSQSDKNTCIITIEDNGKGISEEAKSNMFVPYFTTKSTGTGLGLAMVKQIVELHHGTISYESVENEGTVFSVELPVKNN